MLRRVPILRRKWKLKRIRKLARKWKLKRLRKLARKWKALQLELNLCVIIAQNYSFLLIFTHIYTYLFNKNFDFNIYLCVIIDKNQFIKLCVTIGKCHFFPPFYYLCVIIGFVWTCFFYVLEKWLCVL